MIEINTRRISIAWPEQSDLTDQEITMNALCTLPTGHDTKKRNDTINSFCFYILSSSLISLSIPFKKIKPAIFFSVTALLSSHFGVRRLRIAGLRPLFKKKSGYDGVVTENTSTVRHFFLAASEKSATCLTDSLEI